MSKTKMSLMLGMAMIALPALSKVETIKNKSETVYQVSVDDLNTEKVSIEGQEFNRIRFVGVDGFTGIKHDVGAPEIPVIRFYVNADSKKDIAVEKLAAKKSITKSISNIIPVLPSLEKIKSAHYSASDLVVSKSFVNNKAYEIQKVGVARGVNQYLITLYPAAFVNNQLTLTASFQVTVKNSKLENEIPMKAQDSFLFVVGPKFSKSPSLEQYKLFKKNLGFNVLTLNTTSSDSPDMIRDDIIDLYKQNPSLKYVLIIGDSDDVPAHTSTHISGITDHYYASLDDYENDLNTPELFVGRASVTSELELSKVLSKFTKYVATDYTSQNWIKNVSFLATDDRYLVAEATHNYAIDTYTKKAGFMGFFPASAEKGGDKLYAITHRVPNSKVQEALGVGRTIVDYSGHGANTFWDAPRVTQADVRALKSSSLPFVISNACITGDFRVAESFAETWQRHEFGAIMFWGSMDSTFWDEDDILERKMFDGIFTQKKKHFGEITYFSLAEMWKFYGGNDNSKYYWETYHMFGDPSVNLKTTPFDGLITE